MEVTEQKQPPLPAAGAPVYVQQSLVKLPRFWTKDPLLWFPLAEGQFTLQNSVDPVACYFQVLASLSIDDIWLVQHVLHEETGPSHTTIFVPS
jgi:hypothetical protein